MLGVRRCAEECRSGGCVGGNGERGVWQGALSHAPGSVPSLAGVDVTRGLSAGRKVIRSAKPPQGFPVALSPV